MTKDAIRYSDLPIENTWVEYLRPRLPYSFSEINKHTCERYILSGPQLSTEWAEYHNFWRRGYIYYAVGKLIDCQSLSEYWREYRILHTNQLRNEYSGLTDYLSKSPNDVFNALQLEELWAVVLDNHLDRERAVMTNITQAIEFCLKGISTHAEFREKGEFAFSSGHDLKKLYELLPQGLRREMQIESVAFAKNYATFRKAIEDRVTQLQKPVCSPGRLFARPDIGAWKNIADEIDHTTYSAFINDNDPASVSNPEEWFDRAIRDIGEITYHRYSPFESRDEYPVAPIHLGLMLGRFLYEHLFPVTTVVGKGP